MYNPIKPRNKKKSLSIDEMKNICTQFFGPYKNEWRDKNGIVDNSDTKIAKRLGLDTDRVSDYTSLILKNHINNLNN